MNSCGFLKRFRTEDSGQDLAEYCLLTALLALVAAGIFVQASGGIQAIWGTANTSLIAGNSATTGQTGTPASASSPASAPAGR
jgi:Flp pilus assembly pilin Flp